MTLHICPKSVLTAAYKEKRKWVPRSTWTLPCWPRNSYFESMPFSIFGHFHNYPHVSRWDIVSNTAVRSRSKTTVKLCILWALVFRFHQDTLLFHKNSASLPQEHWVQHANTVECTISCYMAYERVWNEANDKRWGAQLQFPLQPFC